MYQYAALAGLQVAGGLQQAESIRRSADLTQQIAEQNAVLKEFDAYEVEKSGYEEAARYQPQIDQTIASQQAAFAAKDVDINYGTAAEIQAETKATGFYNLLDIQTQARRRALGLKQEARNMRLGGAANKAEAQMNAAAATSNTIVGAARVGLSGYERSKGVK